MRQCSVRGIFVAGANCSFTGHDENTKLSASELVELLESGAVVISHQDRLREKDAIETACYDLGDSCDYETKQAIKRMGDGLK